ncbi:MAG TPA: hypothetical protein VM841_10160 [Actinomycetota bacterium]|nr:hypothetical protein [Actinomycetota bacterium]
MRRLLLSVVVLAVALAGGAVRAAPACPSARTCDAFKLSSQRWAATKGVVTIPYQVNWLGPGSMPGDVTRAIIAAADAWEAANPRIRFKFEGTSYDVPQLGNNRNEIAFVPTLEPGVIAQANHRAKGSVRLESDTLLNLAKPWSFDPCAQQNGSCADAEGPALRLLDLQSVVAQQLGNWLGLHTLSSDATRELTMNGTITYGERRKATLGLGDVKGVRAAYPCGGCSSPRIFTP